MMRPFALLAAAAALAASLWVGVYGVATLPPLGLLLDPVRGVWSAPANTAHPEVLVRAIPGLAGPVEVRYDARAVPHIFATSSEDLFRGLGYVVARDRLFQLDLQARAGAGTLTELVGRRAAVADSEPRHLGMPRAAERQWAALPADAPDRRYAEAYAVGVNAWIDGLTPELVPVEYKLVGRHPARWQAINSVHLLNRMAWTLSYRPPERERLLAEALVGREAARAIFPTTVPIQEPIQPNGQQYPTVDAGPLPGPGAADSVAVAGLRTWFRPGHPAIGMPDDDDIPRIFASNNWAVSPSRSTSGRALLAGDPHLELTLPSIWYEVHLVIPGQLDVYGVTIPGAPGVLIGLTRELAWSMTNTGADVVDYYRETVDDHRAPTRYLLDDAWRDLELREEVYRDPRGDVVRTDTVRFTHRGPIMRMGPDWVSLRWTLYEANSVLGAFVHAAKQQTVQSFLDVLASNFAVPAQNIIVADRQGSIGIRSTGRYPIRPDNGDGQDIRDGSTSASDWSGYWPVSDYPQAVNPAQGYLASANQQPIDPRAQPRYLGSEQNYDPWRALQINRLLRADSSVSLDEMRRFQTDAGSVRADLFLPYFLRASAAAPNGSESLRSADSLLRRWDRRYTVDNTASALFERALRELTRRTWDELIPPGDSVRVATPGGVVLLQLLQDSASAWWDDRRTRDRVESRNDLLAGALAAAFDSLRTTQGPPTAERWSWGRLGSANIRHLLGLAGFSRTGMPVQAGPGTLNPSPASGFGSSWRMVVELGDRVRALGTYPGGQSGNPASPLYDDRLRLWLNGDLELLYAPATLEALAPAQVRASLTLEPPR